MIERVVEPSSVTVTPLHLKIISGLISVSAAIIMLGWLTQNQIIVQISPDFEEIKFNTAFLMFLSGMALYLNKSHGSVSGFLGAFITCFDAVWTARSVM